MTKVLDSKAAVVAAGVGVGVLGLYLIGRGAAAGVSKAAADGIGGLVTGRNRITEGTPYEGLGILGTISAAMNHATGGAINRVNDWMLGKISGVLDMNPFKVMRQD